MPGLRVCCVPVVWVCVVVFVGVHVWAVDAATCLKFHDVGRSSVVVSWAFHFADGQQASRYELFVKEQSDDYYQIYDGPAESQRVEGLKPATSYYFAVHAVDAEGHSLSACIDLVTTGTRCNFLRNHSFEQEHKDPNSAIHWQPLQVDYDIAWDKFRTGSRSIRLAKMYFWQGVGQFALLNLTQPSTITFRYHLAGEEVDLADVHLDIQFQSGKFMYNTRAVQKGTYDFKEFVMAVGPLEPVLSVFVSVVLKGDNGALWLDDFSIFVTKVTPEEEARLTFPRCQCPRLCSTQAGTSGINNFRMYEFFFEASEVPVYEDVTVVTQLTTDRISRLALLVERYRGPVSAAIYVKDPERDLLTIFKSRRDSEEMRKHVDFHVVYEPKDTVPPYPINTLRNVALINVRTSHVALIDVDFVFNIGMHDYVKSTYSILDERKDDAVFVVPAFEMKGDDVPANKEALIDRVIANDIMPVHILKYARAHEATDYTRWYNSDRMYEVEYQMYFEPYIICKKDVPMYDERFQGYGNDKVSHLYALHVAGYKFLVLPEVFTIHLEHEKKADFWEAKRDWDRVWLNWYAFVIETDRHYGGGLYVPKGLEGSQPNCPPLVEGEQEMTGEIKVFDPSQPNRPQEEPSSPSPLPETEEPKSEEPMDEDTVVITQDGGNTFVIYRRREGIRLRGPDPFGGLSEFGDLDEMGAPGEEEEEEDGDVRVVQGKEEQAPSLSPPPPPPPSPPVLEETSIADVVEFELGEKTEEFEEVAEEDERSKPEELQEHVETKVIEEESTPPTGDGAQEQKKTISPPTTTEEKKVKEEEEEEEEEEKKKKVKEEEEKKKEKKVKDDEEEIPPSEEGKKKKKIKEEEEEEEKKKKVKEEEGKKKEKKVKDDEEEIPPSEEGKKKKKIKEEEEEEKKKEKKAKEEEEEKKKEKKAKEEEEEEIPPSEEKKKKKVKDAEEEIPPSEEGKKKKTKPKPKTEERKRLEEPRPAPLSRQEVEDRGGKDKGKSLAKGQGQWMESLKAEEQRLAEQMEEKVKAKEEKKETTKEESTTPKEGSDAPSSVRQADQDVLQSRLGREMAIEERTVQQSVVRTHEVGRLGELFSAEEGGRPQTGVDAPALTAVDEAEQQQVTLRQSRRRPQSQSEETLTGAPQQETAKES